MAHYLANCIKEELKEDYPEILQLEEQYQSNQCNFVDVKLEVNLHETQEIQTQVKTEHVLDENTIGQQQLHFKPEQIYIKDEHLSPGSANHNEDASNALSPSEKCSTCLEVITSESGLQAHLRRHEEERRYECNICLKRCTTKSNLNMHMRIHTGERPYQCDICHKRFNQASALTVHKSLHTDERTYECDICHKQFKLRGNLTKHKQCAHIKEKLYECDICHKRTTTKAYLNRHHLRVHGKEELHECNICHKRFSTKAEHTVHMRTHTWKTL